MRWGNLNIKGIYEIANIIKNVIPKSPTVVGFNIKNLRSKKLNSLYELVDVEDHCSNVVVHSLKINNPSKSKIVIDRVELVNVEVDTTYSFSDVKFQCGLNHEEQNFKIFIFNNGNLKCSDLVYKIHIYRSYPGIEGGKQFLSETVKRFQGINGGDIESLIDENLIEKIKYFDCSSNQLLEFEVYNESNVKLYEMSLVFNEQERIFCTSLGGERMVNDSSKNYCELRKPYRNIYMIPINTEINYGESMINFEIRIFQTCQLKYDINVIYREGILKPIANLVLSNSVNIRIPYYKNESLYKGLGGNIYYYCVSNNILKSNFEEVKKFGRNILNVTED